MLSMTTATTPPAPGTEELPPMELGIFAYLWPLLVLLVLWIGLGYLWNNKYRPRQIKNERPTATFNNILGRVLKFLFKEDTVPSKKIKNPKLAKLFVWRNYYVVSLIASIALFVINYDPATIAMILGAAILTATVRTRKVFYARHKILMRMFEVAAADLGYPKNYLNNPWAYVNVQKWVNMTGPADTVVRFPAKFKSDELKNRESFERHFSGTVTDENTWIYTWKSSESAVILKPVTHIPEMVHYPGSADRKWDEIPIGVGSNGEVVWEISKNPHALVTGTTGAGKSVLQRNLIFHCIQHPDKWRFLGIDVKMVELSPYLKYEPVVMGIATDVEEGVEIIRYANEEMNNRYQRMKEAGVNNFRDLDEVPHALMVMIDESYAFLATTGNKTDEGKAKDALKGEASAAIGDIARLGRAAGVHLVMATQRPDAVVIYGELKQNLSARIAAGRADSIASQMTLDNDNATRLPSIKGRGYFQKDGQGEQFQGYFAEAKWIDEWLQNQQNGSSRNDTVQSETVEKGKSKKKGLFGKIKNRKNESNDSASAEEDVVMDDMESMNYDDFVDPLENLPDLEDKNKELASLVDQFKEAKFEDEYTDTFNGEETVDDSEDVFHSITSDEDTTPDLDSIFDNDDEADFVSPFVTPEEDEPVKAVASKPKPVAKKVETVALPDDDDIFSGDFPDFDMDMNTLDSVKPEPEQPKKVAKPKVTVPPKPASEKVSKPVASAPTRPAAPTRPTLPTRPEMPKRPSR